MHYYFSFFNPLCKGRACAYMIMLCVEIRRKVGWSIKTFGVSDHLTF